MAIERIADGFDAAIHHIRRSDHVGTGAGMAKCLLAKHLNGLIVENPQLPVFVFLHQAIMAVGAVGVERHIGDHAQRRMGLLERSYGARNQTLIIAAFRGLGALEAFLNLGE